VRQYEQWTTLLPRVKPFYAVKCNPDPGLVKTLAHIGAGFDCASHGEIMQVLSYGVDPTRIIMANPCKMASHITGARNLGVSMFTFDNTDELVKIQRLYPNAELVLRILTDDSHSLMRFGSKFGAPPCSWTKIFKTARDLNMNIVGVSFHVGSGCMSPVAFTEALRRARSVFDLAERFGFGLDFLDIGGGFPGSDEGTIRFSEVARAITPVLDELFPPHVRVIGEPGRYLAHSTHTLACTVYARRYIDPEMTAEVPGADSALRYLYYINDGVYGSFNCIFFDHAHPAPIPLRRKEKAPAHKCKIFGPTCDSMDVVAAELELPELSVGDWLYFENMGAYTTASASRFNGFKTSSFYYVYTLPAKLD
jgi:ornithine decarboxylase